MRTVPYVAALAIFGLLLSGCGVSGPGAESESGLRIKQGGGGALNQSATPNVATSEESASDVQLPEGVTIVPPVTELPQDEVSKPSSSAPPTSSEPTFRAITPEEVLETLGKYGLFYNSDQEYIDTAAALSRDGGFEDWVKEVQREAQAQYPAAASQIEQGLSMAEVMEPWIAIYANKKGVSPNIVDWEQNDLLRYIVTLEEWPSIEEFNTMVDTVAFE